MKQHQNTQENPENNLLININNHAQLVHDGMQLALLGDQPPTLPSGHCYVSRTMVFKAQVQVLDALIY